MPRLKRLLEYVLTVEVPQGLKLPQTIQLNPKDQPILRKAAFRSLRIITFTFHRTWATLFG
jgi:hypothetical protein